MYDNRHEAGCMDFVGCVVTLLFPILAVLLLVIIWQGWY